MLCKAIFAHVAGVYTTFEHFESVGLAPIVAELAVPIEPLTPVSKIHSIVSPSFKGLFSLVISPSIPSGPVD